MNHPLAINYITRFFREIYRHIILAIISPQAFGIFLSARLTQLIGGRYEKIMPAGYTERRYRKTYENRPIGWAEETRIYRLWIGSFKICDFTIDCPRTLH